LQGETVDGIVPAAVNLDEGLFIAGPHPLKQIVIVAGLGVSHE